MTTALQLPRIVGHRGAAALAPENTLAGVTAAAAAGARMVEFDAKLSRDGVAMVMHDDRVDRTTDGRGAVADLTVAQLRRLDAGIAFSPAFRGERIPTLAEMLVACLDANLDVNIEIKPCPGRADETARAVMETAASVWPARRTPPLITSFERLCLVRARDIVPAWPVGVLLDRHAPDWQIFADHIDARTINIALAMATPEAIQRYRADGRSVMVYTVNDRDRARAVLALGAVSIITDAPDRMADLETRQI